MLLDVLTLAVLGSKHVSAADTGKTYGSSSTVWKSCESTSDHALECATINVPMDHFAEHPSNKTFSVPMTRLMSKDPNAKTVMINPGGPGVGSQSMVLGSGEYFSAVFGEKYHILGFDPRGIDDSRPLAKCRPKGVHIPNPVKQPLGPLTASSDNEANIYINSGDYYANGINFAKSCAEVTGEYLQYVNTPQTAADMNMILDAIGETKLNYYGISYGTVLGATYAQMFPDRVGKVVLDGVVSLEYYYSQWKVVSTVDADATFYGLLEQCLKERETCPLADGFSSADDIYSSLTRVIDNLSLDPASVYINASAFGVLRSSDVRQSGIFSRLYNSARWPYLARSLAELLKGDVMTPYLHFFGSVLPENPRHSKSFFTADDDEDARDEAGEQMYEAFLAVTFGDKIPADQLTRVKRTRKQIVDEFQPDIGYLAKGSEEILDFYAEAWQYPRGHHFLPQNTTKTASPLLILSNSLDPVTPLRSAQEMNRVFQGSALLELKGMGHSTMSLNSRCIADNLTAYFNNGTLPAQGATCNVDDPYFPDPDLAPSLVQKHGDKVDWAIRKLSQYHAKHMQPILARQMWFILPRLV